MIPLAVAAVSVLSLLGLTFGVAKWNRRSGKVLVLVSLITLLTLVLAFLLVLLTVASGSMG